MCHFNDNIYFMVMVYHLLHISIKKIIVGCIPKPGFFLPFLLFLTLQLETPTVENSWGKPLAAYGWSSLPFGWRGRQSCPKM